VEGSIAGCKLSVWVLCVHRDTCIKNFKVLLTFFFDTKYVGATDHRNLPCSVNAFTAGKAEIFIPHFVCWYFLKLRWINEKLGHLLYS